MKPNEYNEIVLETNQEFTLPIKVIFWSVVIILFLVILILILAFTGVLPFVGIKFNILQVSVW